MQHISPLPPCGRSCSLQIVIYTLNPLLTLLYFSVYGCLESNDAENDQGNGLTAFDEEGDAVRVQEITQVLRGKTP